MSNNVTVEYVRERVAEIASKDGDYELQEHLVMQLFIDILSVVSVRQDPSELRDLAFETLKAKRFL